MAVPPLSTITPDPRLSFCPSATIVLSASVDLPVPDTSREGTPLRRALLWLVRFPWSSASEFSRVVAYRRVRPLDGPVRVHRVEAAGPVTHSFVWRGLWAVPRLRTVWTRHEH